MKVETLKKITIYQKSSIIQLEDVDESDIAEYSKRLSQLLKSKDISILQTTSGCAIIRPSETTLILVTEETTRTRKKESEKIKPSEDIITDDS